MTDLERALERCERYARQLAEMEARAMEAEQKFAEEHKRTWAYAGEVDKLQARVAVLEAIPDDMEFQRQLWDAVNEYAESCGGKPNEARMVYHNHRRMDAVAAVSGVIRAALQPSGEPAECWSGCEDPHCPYTHPQPATPPAREAEKKAAERQVIWAAMEWAKWAENQPLMKPGIVLERACRALAAIRALAKAEDHDQS